MFKSIQYRLAIYTVLLIVSIVLCTVLALNTKIIEAIISGCFSIFALYKMWQHYRKFNQNVLFLLNALENGDYSFHFSETHLSKREKELNLMLNRIKDILANARKAVIENEKFLSLVVESTSTGIIIVNNHAHVQTVNKTALELLGLPVFTHLNQLSSINESYPLLFRAIKPEDQLQLTIPNEREEVQISVRTSEIKLRDEIVKVITLNNIGSELELKEMESWVRLIRVMTHEIMNSIAPITSLSETLLSVYKQPENIKQKSNLQNNTVEAFETIHSTAKGLLSFVESYRKFTAIPKPEIKQIPIRNLIDKAIKLEEFALEQKNIDVKVDTSDDTQTILADENLIFQVLVNLVKNAVEAMPEKGGRLLIRFGKQSSNKTYIEVSNNGTPIDPEVLPHIFIPFFTTKENGSGIGLSISRYIMRLHGGKLTHLTNSDGWTVFTLSC